MTTSTKKNAFGFPAAPATPEKHRPKHKEGKALVQNVKLRIAAATHAAGELAEGMKRGDVELEDFAWEEEFDASKRRR